jgi:hypothetical protein
VACRSTIACAAGAGRTLRPRAKWLRQDWARRSSWLAGRPMVPLVGDFVCAYNRGNEEGIPLKGPQRRDKSAEIVATMLVSRIRADEPYG